jgi:hypothetical protein
MTDPNQTATSKLAGIVAIVKLAEELAPEAIGLILELARSMAGQSVDEVFAEGHGRFQAIIDKARAAQGK